MVWELALGVLGLLTVIVDLLLTWLDVDAPKQHTSGVHEVWLGKEAPPQKQMTLFWGMEQWTE